MYYDVFLQNTVQVFYSIVLPIYISRSLSGISNCCILNKHTSFLRSGIAILLHVELFRTT